MKWSLLNEQSSWLTTTRLSTTTTTTTITLKQLTTINTGVVVLHTVDVGLLLSLSVL